MREYEVAEFKFWGTMWMFVTIVILTLIVSCTEYWKYETKVMAEHGYQKVMLQGYSSPQWQKVENCNVQ